MAIDTAAKRVSATSFMAPGRILPFPDATIDQADRQTVAWAYGGILAAAAAVSAFLHEKISISIGHIGF